MQSNTIMVDTNPKYVILRHIPSPEQYYTLRESASMMPPPASLREAEIALSNSFACFLAFERSQMLNDKTPNPTQEPVGMARLSGDKALFIQLTDVCVHPAHQCQGLGKQLLQMCVDDVDAHAPNAFLSLIADPPGQKLYRNLGFEDVAPSGSVGMFRCKRLQNKARVEEGGGKKGNDGKHEMSE